MEHRHRRPPDAKLFQDLVQAAGHGLIDLPVVVRGDGRVTFPVGRASRGRQPEEVRRAVVAGPVQEERAAENDGRALGARSEQHRQHPEHRVVADDHVGWEFPQNHLQALVLRGDAVDE